MLDETVTVVLAGRKGTDLNPLTNDRALPALPFGGKYRIIDFTLANCMHSGLRQILVLTQYKSLSLQKHIRDGWSIFNPELGEYITTVPPQMRTGENWYSGTADAIYQNLYLLERSGAKWVLLLSGDNIYRMDYAALIKTHVQSESDLTIACREIPYEQTTTYGALDVDSTGAISQYEENLENTDSNSDQSGSKTTSMGIYVFSIETLMTIIRDDFSDENSSHSIENDIIPKFIRSHRVSSYYFGGGDGRVTYDGYWGEIDSLDRYYDVNMDLLKPVSPIDIYQKDWYIRTHQEQSPPCRTIPGIEGTEGIFINSIASSGVVISGSCVQHSILFSNVFVDDEATIQDSIVFNNVHIGKNVMLKKCIVDKDVHIPDGEWIGVDKEKDAERFTITEKGVVIIPKGYQF